MRITTREILCNRFGWCWEHEDVDLDDDDDGDDDDENNVDGDDIHDDEITLYIAYLRIAFW